MRHCVRIYTSNGATVFKHVRQGDIKGLLADGDIVYNEKTEQYRLASSESKYQQPVHNSPTSISWMENRAAAGEFGANAQEAAQHKINAWTSVYDDKAVLVRQLSSSPNRTRKTTRL